MSRRALIIANPGAPGRENYCDGVNRDIENYQAFLKSPIGGLWQEHEIIVLRQPSRAMTTIEVGRQKNVDYSLTIFSGHGYHVADSDSTIVELSPGVDFDSVELRVGAPKRTVILDCCRVLHRTMFTEDSAERMRKAAGSIIHPDDCRKYYDLAISKCPNGMVVLFSCAINETAGDVGAQGGLYSYNLITSAQLWSRETTVDTEKEYRTLSIVAAHELAMQRVRKLSVGGQTPTLEKPRS